MCILNTPVKEVIKAFNDLSEAFLLMRGCVAEPSNTSVQKAHKNMCYSVHNYNWYVEYWNTIAYEWWNHPLLPPRVKTFFHENISEHSVTLLHTKDVLPNNLVDNKEFAWLDNPFTNSDYSQYIEHFTQSDDCKVVSRAIITLMNPVFEDFIRGVPNWLSQTSPVVLQAYDEDNRRHIKIVNDGQKYHYYTSIISDNFKEIENVPPEIDKIVSYIISSKGTLTLADGRKVDDFI